MGAIEDGHFVERDAFLAQLQHPLGDKGRLLPAVAASDHNWFDSAGARGGQFLGKLPDVGRNGGVGQVKDFRRAPVVGFDAVDFGVRMALGEFQNVQEMSAAPGIDALAVVAHRHDVVVGRGQQINQGALQFVGVLVFVHEDELETPLLFFADFGMFFQQF